MKIHSRFWKHLQNSWCRKSSYRSPGTKFLPDVFLKYRIYCAFYGSLRHTRILIRFFSYKTVYISCYLALQRATLQKRHGFFRTARLKRSLSYFAEYFWLHSSLYSVSKSSCVVRSLWLHSSFSTKIVGKATKSSTQVFQGWNCKCGIFKRRVLFLSERAWLYMLKLIPNWTYLRRSNSIQASGSHCGQKHIFSMNGAGKSFKYFIYILVLF